jgi:hypothetical protein
MVFYNCLYRLLSFDFVVNHTSFIVLSLIRPSQRPVLSGNAKADKRWQIACQL